MSSRLTGHAAERFGSTPEERAARAELARADARVDADLVRQFLAGHDQAGVEIVRRHQPRIVRLVRTCLQNPADVEEVVVDTFVRAFRGLATFRGDASLATWLHHIALNLARNRYWYLYRRRPEAASLDEQVSKESGVTMVERVPSKAPDPRQELVHEELLQAITSSMDRLPPAEREILNLRATLEQSYGEIAAAMGINVGTVKSRIARARQHLRAAVETKGTDLPNHAPPRSELRRPPAPA